MVSSKTGEYYTPSEYIEAARTVMGGISLDPASCAPAQEIVKADSWYGLDIDKDGLELDWFGNVWLNPPFAEVRHWVPKLEYEYSCGNVYQAILLTKAALGYNWFEELWRKYPTVLVRKRIQFVNGVAQAKQATAFMYIGEDIHCMWRFCSEFGRYGRVIAPEQGWVY
jgi:hypothetical protein